MESPRPGKYLKTNMAGTENLNSPIVALQLQLMQFWRVKVQEARV